MEDYFRKRENAAKLMRCYIDKLCKLSIEDLEKLLTKIYHKKKHTKRNGIQIHEPVPNIEEIVVNFIEEKGKQVSYEYNMKFHPDDTTYDYWEVESHMITTKERHWVSSYIMGRSWFEPFAFDELITDLCKCRKCNTGMLYNESFRIIDDNKEGEEPTIYFYCEKHYNKIKDIL